MKKMLLFVAAMFTAATSFAQSGIAVAESASTKTITDAVDEASDVAEQFNIMSIPTVIAFKDGEVLNKAVGLQSKESLLALFN